MRGPSIADQVAYTTWMVAWSVLWAVPFLAFYDVIRKRVR